MMLGLGKDLSKTRGLIAGHIKVTHELPQMMPRTKSPGISKLLIKACSKNHLLNLREMKKRMS